MGGLVQSPAMEAALPLAAAGLVLGWPAEWLIQQFPRPAGSPLSPRRQLVVTAILAATCAALGAEIGFEAPLVPAVVLTGLVVPVAAIDLGHRIIPNAITLPGAVAVYATAVAAEPDRALELALAGAATFLFFLLAWLVYRQGIGLGDVKLAGMNGLGLGTTVLSAVVVGFAASWLVAIGLVVTGGRAALKTEIPFGPFLAAGAIAALLWASG